MNPKNVSRRQFIASVGALGASAFLSNELMASQERENYLCFLPRIMHSGESEELNFIVVMCDTWRYDHIGFHGNDWIHTPNVDAFAGQSQVFTMTRPKSLVL